MVSVLSFLFSSTAWLKNVNIPPFWQLLTDTSTEYKSLWAQVPKLPHGKKQEKSFYPIGKNSWFCSISEDHCRSEDSSLFCFISFYNDMVSDRRYRLLCQMWREIKYIFGDNKLIALFQLKKEKYILPKTKRWNWYIPKFIRKTLGYLRLKRPMI